MLAAAKVAGQFPAQEPDLAVFGLRNVPAGASASRPLQIGQRNRSIPGCSRKIPSKTKTDKIVPAPTASKINRHRREVPYGLSYQFCCICHGQYRSVHCHKVDRQARTMTKQKCRCTAIQRHFLVRLTGFEPAAFRVGEL